MQRDVVNIIDTYAEKIKRQFATGHAGELSYRSSLEELIQALLPEYLVTNEATKMSAVDRPDLTIWQKNSEPRRTTPLKPVPVGYVEHKDIGEDLDKPDYQKQLKRYLNLGNVVHTDTLSFRFYINKEKVADIQLAEVNTYGQIIIDSAQYEHIAYWLTKIIEKPVPTVHTPRALAELMADRAKPIRWTIQDALLHDIKSGNDKSQLYGQFAAFQHELIHGLTPKQFSDLYAQTIAYGLFAARYNDTTSKDFTRQEAAAHIPATNPFLQKFFREVAGYETEERITWVLDNFANLFNYCDVHALMSQYGVTTAMNHDPIVHFYETFLAEYDPALRKSRGVYYTPQPVVSFIVRATDYILKSEFSLTKGLADTSKIEVEIEVGQQLTHRKATHLVKTTKRKIEFRRIQVLDPATGTGTFLNEVIKLVYSRFKNQEGIWPGFVEEELLPSLHGFELLMAAYAMAHMKLGITLIDTGYTPANSHRLGVYLTNSLEPADDYDDLPNLFGMTRALSEESHGANKVKSDVPVMVIIGNPPYNVVSDNTGKYISNLMSAYKVEPGGKIKLQERNSKIINDDYVKFIRLAESMIEKNGEGILGYITNHGYLDNPTFRGMRWHLAKTFNKIYVLDLHGNSKKKEVAPDNSKDENVFDIQQGVSIILAFKIPTIKKGAAEIYRADLWGKREAKYKTLSSANFSDIKWQRIEPNGKHYAFTYNKDLTLQSEYDQGISVNDLFIVKVGGIKTSRDDFVIDTDRQRLSERIQDFCNSSLSNEDFQSKYHLKETDDWQLQLNRQSIQPFDNNKIIKIAYRPFDTRWTYWDKTVNSRMRENVMSNFINHDNLGLITVRQVAEDSGFDHVFVSSDVVEGRMTLSNKGMCFVYPLYVYHDDGTHSSNFDTKIIKRFMRNIDVSYKPEDILDYIYAVLYSPRYRIHYKDFLKMDFPKVPVPKNSEIFRKLAGLGRQLRQLHLMLTPIDDLQTSFKIPGNNIVDTFAYKDGRIWINATQYFGNVSETVWNFHIGGYQPAQKWLKVRKGQSLSNEDIEHYQSVLTILDRTQKLMNEIDKQGSAFGMDIAATKDNKRDL